jgi:hypothetical protein
MRILVVLAFAVGVIGLFGPVNAGAYLDTRINRRDLP